MRVHSYHEDEHDSNAPNIFYSKNLTSLILNFAIIGNRGVAHILIYQINLGKMEYGSIEEGDM